MPILEYLINLTLFTNFFFLNRVIYGMVYGNTTKEEAVEKLMTRELEAEFSFAQI